MGRSSRCASCGATVVVTSARTQFRDGAMVLVCRPCAGEPPPVEAEPDYDEMVVAIEQMEEDIDDSYADVEVSIDAEPPDGDGDSTVSGSVDVDERPPRQRDPTLPPVMIDKGR